MDGLTTESTTIIGLSAGVNYTFKVYASENSSSTNDKAACVAITNKTEGPSTAITTLGVLDTTSITAPSTITVKLDNELYTCAQATWTSALTNDSRVRGYNVYVNGDLTQTIYNWELTSAARIGTIATQVGRLTPGIENTIKIVAFTDSGVTYEYTESKITTLTNYDFKAPEFEENASVTATTQSNGDVVLTWNAAKDDTAVSGYRIYVDGTPIYAKEGDVFNPINGKYTTTATTYTITGLDLTKEHIFTVKAGDTWWKAATTMGTYDKMAGFNWTLNGISKTLVGIPQDPEITDPETTIPGNTDSGTTGANVGSDNTSQSGNATDISSDGSNLSAAKTGDVAPIYLFIITLCISMTVLLVISTKKKKSVD